MFPFSEASTAFCLNMSSFPALLCIVYMCEVCLCVVAWRPEEDTDGFPLPFCDNRLETEYLTELKVGHLHLSA